LEKGSFNFAGMGQCYFYRTTSATQDAKPILIKTNTSLHEAATYLETSTVTKQTRILLHFLH
jgi:hypothetical protein